MMDFPVLKRLDVETPLGVVHLVCFDKSGVQHRQVILRVLSEVAGRTLVPRDIVQTKDCPRPAFPGLDFDVNWTHSGDICVLAYGSPEGGGVCRLKIGVDCEIHKPKRLKIAEHFYSPQEVAHIKAQAPEAAETEFFRLWCRKEALYKCVGGPFFEGSLRRSMLVDSLPLEQGRTVYFCDVNLPEDFLCEFADSPKVSLCVAVCR